jgi:hypothetical protein
VAIWWQFGDYFVDLVTICRQFGGILVAILWHLVTIWRQFWRQFWWQLGDNLVRIWCLFGGNLVAIWWQFGAI